MPIPISEFPSVRNVKYAFARSHIKSGDILMCSGNSMFSKLIKGVTGSIWSHVAFILKEESIDRLIVFESVESIGVRVVPLSFYLNNYGGEGKPYEGKLLIARHDDMKNADTKKLAKISVDLLGHNYGWLNIIKIASRIGLSMFSKVNSCRKPTREKNKEYICSEYAYQIYSSMGLYIEPDCRGFVAPANFAKTQEINAVFGLV